MTDCPYKHLLVLDFETTCEKDNHDFPREIIQFGVAVINVENNEILEEKSFNEYVRPVQNSVLSEFCTEFTGITQEQVDAADVFSDIYERFLEWLKTNGFEEKTFAFVTDSRQDMWHIAQYQFRLIKKSLPKMFRQWINMKRVFNFRLEDGEFENLVGSTNIAKMANHLEVPFVGRSHDALADCLNLARITQKILATGCNVNINEMLSCSAKWRHVPLDMSKVDGWRTDFQKANKVYERILILVVQKVNNYDLKDYGICRYCHSGPSLCGKIPRQWEARLYQYFEEQGEQSVFAMVGDYY